MVLSDPSPLLSVSSPINNIALLHKDAASAGNAVVSTLSGQKATTPSTPAAGTAGTAGTAGAAATTETSRRGKMRVSSSSSTTSSETETLSKDVPAVIIAVVLISHFQLKIPLAETFLYLQNQDPLTGLYSKTWTDLNFIGFWIVVFTFLRAFVMTVVLKPFAIWAGVKKEHQQNRFQEEGWVCIYYSISWNLGMYVLRTSPVWNNWTFWFKPEALFEGYPHTHLPHVMMWYYYVQLAFWLQQIFVLHIEAPRKDFWALLAHHTVTLLLISGSALSNFWRAGNVVFVVMDLADIILAFSKSMKYLGVSNRICDVFFGTFMVTWLYTRHYMYAYILHGFMFTAYEMIPFELDISQGKWYCRELAWLPTLGLALLQILMVYWFALILRILVKILRGHSAEDDRSDDEADPEPVEFEEKKKAVK
ncbi:sphingosine N-acyltransferase lag1 [Linnemannia gamsii]|uniref:Sphingosine N-acyltransferase lag1 n=1 Tax=Linnemannia gamsii TaxID=64522 RepID=A0A9P6R696_9FUNG|nr:sphingosine N-acyltransferase lag1 [Linnemannia gamsii]